VRFALGRDGGLGCCRLPLNWSPLALDPTYDPVRRGVVGGGCRAIPRPLASRRDPPRARRVDMARRRAAGVGDDRGVRARCRARPARPDASSRDAAATATEAIGRGPFRPADRGRAATRKWLVIGAPHLSGHGLQDVINRVAEHAGLPKGTAAAFERRATPEEERPLPRRPGRVRAAGRRPPLVEAARDCPLRGREPADLRALGAHDGQDVPRRKIGAWWISGAPPGRGLVTSAPGGDQLPSCGASSPWPTTATGCRVDLRDAVAHRPAGSRLLVGFGAQADGLRTLSRP
jgi:hypothetical protein